MRNDDEKNFETAAELIDLLREHRQYIEADNDIGENRTGPEILRILKKVPKRHLRHVTTIIRDDDPRAGETLDILVGKTNNS